MRRPRTTTLAFAVGAVVVVVVSVLLTRGRGDAALPAPEPPRFSGSLAVQRMPSLLHAATLSSPVTVAVIRDDAAATFYDSASVLDSIVDAWRDMLAKIDARVVVEPSHALSLARRADVVVIPSSPCLSLATRELLDNARARGQGIILTGRAGTEDAACRPIGFGLVIDATRASRAAVLNDRPMVYVSFPVGSPLAADIPPGARVDLKPASQVALRVRSRDAIYTDYSLQPQPAEKQVLLDVAVTRGRYGKSRLVYWGFELRDAASQPWNLEVLRLLVRNSVAWAASLPVVRAEPWPRGKLAAAAFAQDVEDRFANSRHALDSLKSAGVPATYFLTSNLALRNSNVAHDLNEAGEVGTHSENHRRLGGLPLEVQRRRLDVTQQELTYLFGQRVRGLRPPEEQFDSATMAAWVASGGTYLFGANDSRAAAPELLRVGHDTLVLLGRVGGDDFAMAARGRNSNDDMTGAFVDEFEQAKAQGGLYVLSYHSQLLGTPERVPVLARVARRLAADTTVWIATTGAIAQWWKNRADLTLTAAARGNQGIDVTIRNVGSHFVQGAVARITLPQPRRVDRANAVLLPSEMGEARFVIPTMAPTSTQTVRLIFVGAKDEARSASPSRSVRVRSRPRHVPPQRKWYQFWKR